MENKIYLAKRDEMIQINFVIINFIYVSNHPLSCSYDIIKMRLHVCYFQNLTQCIKSKICIFQTFSCFLHHNEISDENSFCFNRDVIPVHLHGLVHPVLVWAVLWRHQVQETMGPILHDSVWDRKLYHSQWHPR